MKRDEEEIASGSSTCNNQVFHTMDPSKYISSDGPLSPVRLHLCETAKTGIESVEKVDFALDLAPKHLSI